MIIAIDVGGTKISAALLSDDKIVNDKAIRFKIIEQRKIASVIHSDLPNLSQHLITLCQGWGEQATQVAIACTGQVGNECVNFLSANQALPLKAQLEKAFKLPVTIINDAAAAAWAEYCSINNETKKNHAKDDSPTPAKNRMANNTNNSSDDTLVYITVSTGIGGGIIQNGQLVTCEDGFCAHLGHVSVQHSRKKSITCHCGRINCVEAIASGTAIAAQASLILNKKVNCEAVFTQYITVTEIAQLIDDASSAVCDLIANIKAITGTNRLVLGGSVGSADIFHQQVQTKVAKLAKIYQVNITRPNMGADADLIGAALYVNKQ